MFLDQSRAAPPNISPGDGRYIGITTAGRDGARSQCQVDQADAAPGLCLHSERVHSGPMDSEDSGRRLMS